MAPGQETSLASPRSNQSSFGSKCTVLKKVLPNIAGTFPSSPQWFDARVIVPPRYAPGHAKVSAGLSEAIAYRLCKCVAEWASTGVIGVLQLARIRARSNTNPLLLRVQTWLSPPLGKCGREELKKDVEQRRGLNVALFDPSANPKSFIRGAVKLVS